MKISNPKTVCAAALVLSLFSNANASPQLALAQGCYSCHGVDLRGEAPNFKRLADKLSSFRGDAAAQAKFVEKYRAGKAFERVEAHERLSVETATALVHWLAEGGD